MLGHDGAVNFAKFSTDGTRIASSSTDKTVLVVGTPRPHGRGGNRFESTDDGLDWLLPLGAGRGYWRLGALNGQQPCACGTLAPAHTGRRNHCTSSTESREPVWPADSAETEKIAAVTARGTVQVFDDAMRPLGEPIKPESGVSTSSSATTAGSWAIAEDNGTVRLWDSQDWLAGGHACQGRRPAGKGHDDGAQRQRPTARRRFRGPQ